MPLIRCQSQYKTETLDWFWQSTTGGLMRENRSGELLPHMRIMRDPYQMLDYCAKTLHLEFLIRFYAQTFF